MAEQPLPGDRPTVTKRARGEGRARLRREADLLGRCAHPGVAELVELRDNGDETVLVAVRAGHHTVDEHRPSSLAEIAGVVAAVAETLADLHHTGFVHGRVDPSHIVLAATGRPVLCGFGDAGAIGSPWLEAGPARAGYADPAGHRGSGRATATDVYALGVTLRALLDRHRRDGHDTSLASRVLDGTILARRRLAAVAVAATRADPRRRPSARELADQAAAAVAAPRLPVVPEADPGGVGPTPEARAWRSRPARSMPRPQPRERRAPRLAAVGIAAVVVAIGVSVVLSLGSGADRSADTVAVAPSVSTTVRAACNPAVAVCIEEVDVRNGVVDTGDARFVVGHIGDEVVVGDWDCDGNATPALLRPSTGEVFLFERWADAGEDLTVTATTRISNATAIRAIIAPDGCDRVAVDHLRGTWFHDADDLA